MAGQVSEAVARPVRTAGQMTPAYLVVLLIDETVYNLSDTAFAAAVVLLGLVFGFIQTALENRQGKAWWLREVPPTRVPPAGG